MSKYYKSLVKIICIVLMCATIRIQATRGIYECKTYDIILQDDQKIIVAGAAKLDGVTRFMTARYTPFGSVDTTYGYNGCVVIPFDNSCVAHALTLIDDKAVVVGGLQNEAGGLVVARYDSSGMLDEDFNETGFVIKVIGNNAVAYDVMLANNKKYIVAGSALINNVLKIVLARYDADGQLDNGFGTQGIVTTLVNNGAAARAITKHNNKILVAGFSVLSNTEKRFLVSRYNNNGLPDTSFNGSGHVVTPIGINATACALEVLPSGHIIAAGTSDNQFALVKYKPNGTRDNSFGDQGIVTSMIGANAQINDIAIQLDGKIVAVGFVDDQVALVRYQSNGSIDTTFGNNGIVKLAIGIYAVGKAIVLQPDGKLLVAGGSNNGSFVLRYNENGKIDTTFGIKGIVKFPNIFKGPDVYDIVDSNIANNAGITYSKLQLADSIQNKDIASNAAIHDSKLGTIKTPGKVMNQATSATPLNIANTIVTRDTLGNFTANMVMATLFGSVIGNASDNVLKTGDTMSGPLVLAAGSVLRPSLQFNGNEQTGLSAHNNTITLSSNGVEHVVFEDTGSVIIAPPLVGAGLQIQGGGIQVVGDVVVEGNIRFKADDAMLNVVGTTQGLRKVFTGVGNTGAFGTVTIHFGAADFNNPPIICVNAINGVSASITINNVTATSADITSNLVSVPFNFIAIGN